MLGVIAAVFLAQQPTFDAMEYVSVHRDADAALVAGRIDEALAGFERCRAMAPFNTTVIYALACTEARAGKTGDALDWLERAAELGYADAAVAAWDLDLASLRNQPRFVAALERMRKSHTEPSADPKLVRIWDSRTKHRIHDVAVHPSGQCVAVGQSDGIIQILDGRTGQALRSSPDFGDEVWTLDFDKQGERVAALTWDGKLHFWPIDGRTEAKTVEGLAPPEEDETKWSFGARVQYDSTGERVLVAGRDRGGSLWSASGVHLHTWFEPLGYLFDVLVAWSPDGERIAIPREKRVQFVSGRTGEPEGEPLETPAPVTSLAYQPGGQLLATGHDDRYLRVWDLKTRKLVFEHFYPDIFEASMDVNSVAFSPDGRWIAGGTGEMAYVHVLDCVSGKLESEFDWSGGHFAEPYELRWSIDSKRLWFAFCCGGMSLDELRLDKSMPKSIGYSGRSPRVGRSGLAIGNAMWSVLSLDAKTGRCLWDRANLGREGSLLKTSTGHFTTDVASLDEISVETGCEGEDSRPLSELATVLFDPKRVRAAREAVALMPVTF